MSAGQKVIKAELGMMDLEYGVFGAFYASGRIFGCILFGMLANSVNRKYLISGAALVECFSLCSFYVSSNGPYLMIIRLIGGICHMFPHVYGPIWVDQFSVNSSNSKYFMNSIFSLAGNTGRASGYLLDLFFGSENWRLYFLINGVAMGVLGILLLFHRNIYFSSRLVAVKAKDGKELLTPSEARICSIYNIRTSDPRERDANVFSKYSDIFTNGCYLSILYARLCITTIQAIFRTQMTGYADSVLGFKDRYKRTLVYCAMLTTGPYTGSFIGGYFTKAVGGYQKANSILIMLVFDILACIVLTPITFTDDYRIFLFNCYMFYLCGGAILPNINGIQLSSVPERLKVPAKVIASIANQAIANLPVPVIYGLINDKMKVIDKRWTFRFFTYFIYTGPIALTFAYVFRLKYGDNPEKRNPLFGEKPKEIEVAPASMNAFDDIDGNIYKLEKRDEAIELKEQP